MAAALLGLDRRQDALQRLWKEEHMAGGIQDGCCSPRIGQEAGGPAEAEVGGTHGRRNTRWRLLS